MNRSTVQRAYGLQIDRFQLNSPIRISILQMWPGGTAILEKQKKNKQITFSDSIDH